MKREALLLPILVAMVLVAMTPPRGWAGTGHDFRDDQCGLCHRTEGRDVSEEVRDGTDGACLGCHSPCLQGKKHAGDRATPASMKTILPLDTDGVMACRTCHDPHRGAVDGKTGRRTRLLHLDGVTRELCFNCHRSGR
jgi:hypothetical protein